MAADDDTGLAWVLNLDADLELGAGAGYEPSKGVLRAMKAPVVQLAASLVGPGDVVVDAGTGDRARGRRGRAFCPTPRAIAALLRAGAEPEAHPPVDVLRRVNSRAFASALGRTLPDASFVTDLDTAVAVLGADPSVGEGWRVKHAFGMAGRGQRVLVAPPKGAPGAADLVFVRTGLAQGGVQIEPNVAIEAEYAVHGRVAPDGATRLGALVRQRCDARGAWRSTELAAAAGADASGVDIRERLAAEACVVGAALFDAGYFGPFGVDAYTYRDRGRLVLQPRSEINARYSMGFAVGFPSAHDRAFSR